MIRDQIKSQRIAIIEKAKTSVISTSSWKKGILNKTNTQILIQQQLNLNKDQNSKELPIIKKKSDMKLAHQFEINQDSILFLDKPVDFSQCFHVEDKKKLHHSLSRLNISVTTLQDKIYLNNKGQEDGFKKWKKAIQLNVAFNKSKDLKLQQQQNQKSISTKQELSKKKGSVNQQLNFYEQEPDIKTIKIVNDIGNKQRNILNQKLQIENNESVKFKVDLVKLQKEFYSKKQKEFAKSKQPTNDLKQKSDKQIPFTENKMKKMPSNYEQSSLFHLQDHQNLIANKLHVLSYTENFNSQNFFKISSEMQPQLLVNKTSQESTDLQSNQVKQTFKLGKEKVNQLSNRKGSSKNYLVNYSTEEDLVQFQNQLIENKQQINLNKKLRNISKNDININSLQTYEDLDKLYCYQMPQQKYKQKLANRDLIFSMSGINSNHEDQNVNQSNFILQQLSQKQQQRNCQKFNNSEVGNKDYVKIIQNYNRSINAKTNIKSKMNICNVKNVYQKEFTTKEQSNKQKYNEEFKRIQFNKIKSAENFKDISPSSKHQIKKQQSNLNSSEGLRIQKVINKKIYPKVPYWQEINQLDVLSQSNYNDSAPFNPIGLQKQDIDVNCNNSTSKTFIRQSYESPKSSHANLQKIINQYDLQSQKHQKLEDKNNFINKDGYGSRLSIQEKSLLINDLKKQVYELVKLNKVYREASKVKNAEQLGFELKSTSFNSNQMQTLQDIFFECANKAIQVKIKYDSQINEQNPKSKIDQAIPKHKKHSIEEKTHQLLSFVTNRHVLQVLYDVMFKFKRIINKKDVILNQQINSSISNDFLTEINTVIQESFPVASVQELKQNQDQDYYCQQENYQQRVLQNKKEKNPLLSQKDAKKLALQKLLYRKQIQQKLINDQIYQQNLLEQLNNKTQIIQKNKINSSQSSVEKLQDTQEYANDQLIYRARFQYPDQDAQITKKEQTKLQKKKESDHEGIKIVKQKNANQQNQDSTYNLARINRFSNQSKFDDNLVQYAKLRLKNNRSQQNMSEQNILKINIMKQNKSIQRKYKTIQRESSQKDQTADVMIKGEKAKLIQYHLRVNSYNGPLLSITNDEKVFTQSKGSSKIVISPIEHLTLQEQIKQFKKSHDLLNENKLFINSSDYKTQDKKKIQQKVIHKTSKSIKIKNAEPNQIDSNQLGINNTNLSFNIKNKFTLQNNHNQNIDILVVSPKENLMGQIYKSSKQIQNDEKQLKQELNKKYGSSKEQLINYNKDIYLDDSQNQDNNIQKNEQLVQINSHNQIYTNGSFNKPIQSQINSIDNNFGSQNIENGPLIASITSQKNTLENNENRQSFKQRRSILLNRSIKNSSRRFTTNKDDSSFNKKITVQDNNLFKQKQQAKTLKIREVRLSKIGISTNKYDLQIQNNKKGDEKQEHEEEEYELFGHQTIGSALLERKEYTNRNEDNQLESYYQKPSNDISSVSKNNKFDDQKLFGQTSQINKKLQQVQYNASQSTTYQQANNKQQMAIQIDFKKGDPSNTISGINNSDLNTLNLVRYNNESIQNSFNKICAKEYNFNYIQNYNNAHLNTLSVDYMKNQNQQSFFQKDKDQILNFIIPISTAKQNNQSQKSNTWFSKQYKKQSIQAKKQNQFNILTHIKEVNRDIKLNQKKIN